MQPNVESQAPTAQSSTHTIPKSILSVSRDEYYDGEGAAGPSLDMRVLEGEVPKDIYGHVFIVIPTGSVDSQQSAGTNTVFPSADGWTSFFNGDGMVFRLDFNRVEEGKVFLSNRMMKPPCYYADVATHRCQKFASYEFDSYGITRLSKLGIRNQLNTAFLPMPAPSNEPEQPDRLLVTWDAGRPYKLDTETLEPVTPVGRNDEWELASPILQFSRSPFPQVQSAAHPCFDRHKQEMFTANTSRSIVDFIPPGFSLLRAWKNIKQFIRQNTVEVLFRGIVQFLGRYRALAGNTNFFESIKSIFQLIWSLFQPSKVYLVRWNGKGELEKWEVTLDSGKPIRVQQATHQIGLTEDYIILVDTAFKISLSQLIAPPKNSRTCDRLKSILTPESLPDGDENVFKTVEGLIRYLLDYPQSPDNRIYIVRRADLETGKQKGKVTAKLVILKGEVAHFLVDYRNPQHEITFHLSHVCAWDAGAWITKIDTTVPADPIDLPSSVGYLSGLTCGPMDINRLGCAIINGETGEVVNQWSLSDRRYTWEPALYAYRDYPIPDRIDDIYWACTGCWEEILTDHIFDLYADYKHRKLSTQEVLGITRQGIRANLLHVRIAPQESIQPAQQRMRIAGVYEFDWGYVGTSPQFVPKTGDKTGSTDGYLVCVVHYGDGSEADNGAQIWIFDAADVSRGPICKLWHPNLNWGFTIHTTWLPKIARRQASYHVPPEEDYKDLVSRQPPEVQELFQTWVYPKQEPPMEANHPES